MADLPPVLLLNANPDAVQDLGRRGVPLLTRRPGRIDPLRRARIIPTALPPLTALQFPDAATVSGIAAARPGSAVIPTADASLVWFSLNRERFPTLRHALPPHESIYRLLNKRHLYALCDSLGIPTPRTVYAGPGFTPEQAAGLRFPIVLKPQGRFGGLHWLRALDVPTPAALPAALARFTAEVRYVPEMTAADPEVARPILQERHEITPGVQYHLCGYVTPGGAAAFRAKRTLLKYPLSAGNGLCFESAPVIPELRERILTLCRAAGYHGMFEAEFITTADEHLLIDFNPRCYNGMALESARGLPLPWFAYLAATGQDARLEDEVARAAAATDVPDLACCRTFYFQVMLLGQRLSGGLSRRETAHWRAWFRQTAGRRVDTFVDPADPWLGRLHIAQTLLQFARDPRFLAGTFIRPPRR